MRCFSFKFLSVIIDAFVWLLSCQSGNRTFNIEIIANSDHHIILCETGSMKERSKRGGKDWSNYAPADVVLINARRDTDLFFIIGSLLS